MRRKESKKASLLKPLFRCLWCILMFYTCFHPDPGIESNVLAGHEDSVWGLTYSAVHHRLASCSADGTIRIWDPQNSSPCLSVFNKERGTQQCWMCGLICLFIFCVFAFYCHMMLGQTNFPPHGTNKVQFNSVQLWTVSLMHNFIFLLCCFCVFSSEHGTPTSVAFVAADPNQVVASFDGGETLLYDLNTEQSVISLETQTKDGRFGFLKRIMPAVQMRPC